MYGVTDSTLVSLLLRYSSRAMMKSSMLLLLGAAAAVIAMPAPHDYVVHERRDYIPNSWIKSKKLDGSTTLPVRIGLTQSNLDRGHDLLMEMYAANNRLFMM